MRIPVFLKIDIKKEAYRLKSGTGFLVSPEVKMRDVRAERAEKGSRDYYSR